MDKTIHARETKYCTAIREAMQALGHATNAELLKVLRITYPNLSATTVHRATARLAERGVLAEAPTDHDGSKRYDNNITPHDHFMCRACSLVRDVDIVEQVKSTLESSLDGCKISGRITISGVCKQCSKGECL